MAVYISTPTSVSINDIGTTIGMTSSRRKQCITKRQTFGQRQQPYKLIKLSICQAPLPFLFVLKIIVFLG